MKNKINIIEINKSKKILISIVSFVFILFLTFNIESTQAADIRADVDQNATINSVDAMLTLRNSLGLDMSGTNWQSSATTGDVDCNGSPNSIDAMLILRYSLGLSMEETGWCDDSGAPASAIAVWDIPAMQSILLASKLQYPDDTAAVRYVNDVNNFDGYIEPWFYGNSSQEMIFAMTDSDISSSEKARCELRQGPGDWFVSSNTPSTFVGEAYIPIPTGEVSEITFAQIHATSIYSLPLIRLSWMKDRGGVLNHLWLTRRLTAHDNTYEKIDLGVNPEGYFDVSMAVANSILDVNVNGTALSFDISNWDAVPQYFKLGLYQPPTEGAWSSMVKYKNANYEKQTYINLVMLPVSDYGTVHYSASTGGDVVSTINELDADDGLTYAYRQDSSTSARFTMEVPDLPSNATNISVTVVARQRKANTTDNINGSIGFQIEDQVYEESFALTDEWETYSNTWETNPYSTLPWTIDDLTQVGTSRLLRIKHAFSELGTGEEGQITQMYMIIRYELE
ncbi:MAG TPA: hypothetical protein EYG92_02880 [Lutibacter sp.]|nr:hypothetical protein [Lutibacter sp.]